MSAAPSRPGPSRRRRVIGAVAAVLVIPLLTTYAASAGTGAALPVDSGVRIVPQPPPTDSARAAAPVGAAESVPEVILPLPERVPSKVQPLEAAATAAPPSGARVVSMHWLDPHMVDLVIESGAMGDRVPVRLLLPRDWYSQPAAQFPTLYLMPGYGEPEGYGSWTVFTDAQQFFRGKNAIVALPSAGDAGYFSDWWNYGDGGSPGWETFHTVELPQILEQGWRANDRRAVAGLSMGGYGAMAYAARNPGFYQAAASYSGLLHTTMPGVDRVTLYTVAQQDLDPYALWGDPQLQAGIWAEHDPWVQAEKLEGTALYVSAAVGMRGEHDDGDLVDRVVGTLEAEDETEYTEVTVLASSLETVAYVTSQSFVERLDLLGIPVTTSFQQEGTHSWGYWQEELHRSWPLLAGGLGLPPS